MTPLTDIAGFDLGLPRLWPMGIGAGQPRRMERTDGQPWCFAFTWDEAGRLADVRLSFRPGDVSTRDVYRWSGDRLDRIAHFDSTVGDVFGDEPEYELVWTWGPEGRPVRVVTTWPFDTPEEPVEDWAWSEDGLTARITTSSRVGVVTERTVTFDAEGRLLRAEDHRDNTGPVDRVLEAEWSADGRLLSARKRGVPGLAEELVVRFRHDEHGRLIGQSSSLHPGADLWIYRHEEDPSP